MTDQELDLRLLEIPVPDPNPEWRIRMQKKLKHNPWNRRLLLAGLAACAALGASLQTNELFKTSLVISGANLIITTRAESISSRIQWRGLGNSVYPRNSPDWILRYTFDNSTQTVWGYETRLVPVSSGRYRIEFRALTEDPHPNLHAAAKSFRWIAPDEIPKSREVQFGEVVTVDLRDHLRDELQVIPGPSPILVEMQRAPLRVNQPVLEKDGNRIGVDPTGGLSGNALMIFWPGEKTLTLQLDKGFKEDHIEIGFVDGKTLEFDLDGHHYVLKSDWVIADEGRRPIYGFVSPNQEEKGLVFFGSRD